ncbi:uncharacterized protein LOC105199362 [Solenopsis invicta]|uniref:uncharacterized protein LOC105199362 n=1 Tax=Solenopsis invicta TaxID=13686 RepID=UPI000595F792|nr:uncharacterized protein LOC105199362 [Solenopsis invicta]
MEQPCEDDNDCGPNFYCYRTSKLCVNFTLCSRYYRAEGTAPARDETQCGPCIVGFRSEILTDGKESPCRKTGEHYQGPVTTQVSVIIALFSFLFFGFVLWSFYMHYRKWCRNIICKFNCFGRNIANTDAATTNATNSNNDPLTIATAPLEEQTPFIIDDVCRVHDKNVRTTYNEYQNATPCVPPAWVNANSLYNNGHANVPNEENVAAQPQNDISTNWSIIPRPMVEPPDEINTDTEQRDNTMNINIFNTMQRTHSDSHTDFTAESNNNSDDKKKKNEARETTINVNQSLQLITNIKVKT